MWETARSAGTHPHSCRLAPGAELDYLSFEERTTDGVPPRYGVDTRAIGDLRETSAAPSADPERSCACATPRSEVSWKRRATPRNDRIRTDLPESQSLTRHGDRHSVVHVALHHEQLRDRRLARNLLPHIFQCHAVQPASPDGNFVEGTEPSENIQSSLNVPVRRNPYGYEHLPVGFRRTFDRPARTFDRRRNAWMIDSRTG